MKKIIGLILFLALIFIVFSVSIGQAPIFRVRLFDTNFTHYLQLMWNEDRAANQTLNFITGAGDRTISLAGNLTLTGSNQVASWGIGVAIDVQKHLNVQDTGVDPDSTHYYGIYNNHRVNTGTHDESDDFYGIINYVEFDENGTVIGNMIAVSGIATLTDGTIGDGQEDLRGGSFDAIVAGGVVADDVFASFSKATIATGTVSGDVYGVYGNVDGNSGTVTGAVYGGYFFVDLEAAMTSVGGNVMGAYVGVDADENPTGTVYMLYLDEGTGIDYGIYQNGSADNYIGGNIGIANGKTIGQAAGPLLMFDDTGNDLELTGSDFQVDSDTFKVQVGDDQDASFYSTGAAGYLDNDTGIFYIRNEANADMQFHTNSILNVTIDTDLWTIFHTKATWQGVPDKIHAIFGNNDDRYAQIGFDQDTSDGYLQNDGGAAGAGVDNGNAFGKNGGAGWAELSARKYKSDIKDIRYGLNEILQYRPRQYIKGNFEIGIVAEEAVGIIPHLVGFKNGEVETFNYTQLIPVLIRATQEQQEMIDSLQTQISGLRGMLFGKELFSGVTND